MLNFSSNASHQISNQSTFLNLEPYYYHILDTSSLLLSLQSSHKMSSRSSSSNSHTTRIQHDTFRSYKSKDYTGDMTQRTSSQGRGVVILNHHARTYDKAAPSPIYRSSHSKKSP
ncbi:hypothetical protein F5Y19DRAFT_350088 [Xylariaceae sp. FL1651]|nr:hypothetical protein F5Y19DRAFT_350088 [Xylariaceae sp. FL1651]